MDKDHLLKILVNYNNSISAAEQAKITTVFCYNPRNAILFVDKNDAVIAYIELCFECFGNRIEPATLKIGNFCDDKYEKIKNLFHSNGIRYGIERDDENEKMAYINSQLQKHPKNSILLMALGKLKMDEGDFVGALSNIERSIQLDSTSRNSYFLRGHCRLVLKDFVGAIDDFDKVIKFDSGTTQAYKERALAKIGKLQLAYSEELALSICDDLEAAGKLGDHSIIDLQKRYCVDE